MSNESRKSKRPTREDQRQMVYPKFVAGERLGDDNDNLDPNLTIFFTAAKLSGNFSYMACLIEGEGILDIFLSKKTGLSAQRERYYKPALNKFDRVAYAANIFCQAQASLFVVCESFIPAIRLHKLLSEKSVNSAGHLRLVKEEFWNI
jgi:hypothetical protein